MHQYLAGQGYWSYIEGAEEIAPDLIVPHEVARRQPGNVLLGNTCADIAEFDFPGLIIPAECRKSIQM